MAEGVDCARSSADVPGPPRLAARSHGGFLQGEAMLNRFQFSVVMVLAAATLVLVFANMVLFSRNRAQQQEINNRQLYIQQSAQLEGLYQQLIRAVAELSARNNDATLGEVLARQGITFSVAPAAPQNPADAAATGRAVRK